MSQQLHVHVHIDHTPQADLVHERSTCSSVTVVMISCSPLIIHAHACTSACLELCGCRVFFPNAFPVDEVLEAEGLPPAGDLHVLHHVLQHLPPGRVCPTHRSADSEED